MPATFTFQTGMEFEILETCSAADIVRSLQAAGLPAVRGRGDIHREFSVVRDGSCGLEVVTPIMGPESFARTSRSVCEALTRIGCRVDETCGGHVHVSVAELRRRSPAEFHMLRNVPRRAVNFEATLDLLVPAHRRGNGYCKSNAALFGRDPIEQTETLWEKIQSVHTERGLVNLFNPRDDRYFRVNLTSLERHGTVEFRQGPGSLDAAYWTMRARFLHAFCLVAAKQIRLHKKPVNIVETPDVRFRKLMRDVPADVVRYMRRMFDAHRANPSL